MSTEEPLDTQVPLGKVYKDVAIGVGAFLGGPLVAGYFFAENFKTLGEPEKVRPTWIITLVATVIIFGIVLLIPEDMNLPSQLIPIAYIGAAYGLFKKHQETQVEEHLSQGGLHHKWARVAGIGVVGLCVTMTPIVGYIYLDGGFSLPETASKNYGSAQHEIEYETEQITEAEIDALAEAFRVTGFFDEAYTKYVYVLKEGAAYDIRISVVEGIEQDAEALEQFEILWEDLRLQLPDKEIQMKLVVDYLDNVVKEYPD